ncbi:glutathione S-transferase family protein [Rhizobium sp. EC-SD404]|uniref:glutathione S-transferase family protein n=1 Tax=Rhizobium sp. EC-SD404 TaxID=2038389 RepID=UPI001259A106|nr:glutathione S-transferase family protein [Rhizobium sp. EC-SD404]VVT26998.1 Glutathione S-transferase [Rhizobium sp. EC-SD404]
MSNHLIIWTYDWVPEGPRGFVRDARLRWACEEAGLDYHVKTVSFEDRGPSHFARQPFGQVPFLEDDGIVMFESGAAVLHLAAKSETLMPSDPQGAAETRQWIIAALNSIEMVSVPWWFVGMSNPDINPLEDWLTSRLEHLETVLAEREWLAAGRFTAADLLMADVLRVPKLRAFGTFPALTAYVDRVCSRPAFEKAKADQIAHFAQADAQRELAK